MTQETLSSYNVFRALCLHNAEDSVRAAESLLGQGVNHITFQLSVLALEEVGKIFIGWYNLNNRQEEWGKSKLNLQLDDHVKKLFWAIWGPSFFSEHLTPQQFEEDRNLASSLHAKRLEVMYTEPNDTQTLSTKISDDEAETYVGMARARLELAKAEGDLNTDLDENQQADIDWFLSQSDHPGNRAFIFSNAAHGQLVKLGNVKLWVQWLREYFSKQESELREITEKELARQIPDKGAPYEPKWRIRIKITSTSHSIRANVLHKFKTDMFKLHKGAGNHTLLIDVILPVQIDVHNLWDNGWLMSKVFIAALNVATNGFFYWHAMTDTSKYYEEMQDLETRRRLELRRV